jgi:lysophospholipase L1-like esterase
MNRRTLLKSSAVAVLSGASAVHAQDKTADATGVGGYSYRLPEFTKGSRLLFQGDSITDMKWGRNQADRNHYLGHSYVYLIASRLGVDMPQAQLEFFNRGVSGNRVGDLRKRWQEDAVDMKPDLLSVLIGTNDAGKSPDGIDIEQWEKDYRFILDSSRKANPNLRVVLLDPFLVRSGRMADPAVFENRNGQIQRLLPIVAKLASDYEAVHIRTQELFDAAAEQVSAEHWIWDGVHPLPQGHELIARQWLHEVSGRWGVAQA